MNLVFNVSEVWLSMVTRTRNLCFAFNPTKCTHKHHEHTPRADDYVCICLFRLVMFYCFNSQKNFAQFHESVSVVTTCKQSPFNEPMTCSKTLVL